MQHTPLLKPLPFAIALAFSTVPNMAFSADTTSHINQQQKRYTFNIAAGSLSASLNAIAKKSGINIAFAPKLTQGKSADKIHGKFSLAQALSYALSKTELVAQKQPKGSYVVIEKSTHIGTLATTVVDVSEKSDNTTEGTNSYTIASMNTATLMNLSIKETPQSISVITNQKMKDFKIENLTDIAKYTTGLDSEVFDSERSSFYARGFEISNYKIDGISTGMATNFGGTKQNSAIYDRIEIVRGSDGLLSTDGTPAATINFVRKKANSQEFKGNATLEVGSWNDYKAGIDISAVLNKQGSIRGRVSLDYNKNDSYIDFYSNEETMTLATIEADLSNNTLLSAGVSHQGFKAKGVSWGALPDVYSDGSATKLSRSHSAGAPWSGRENLQLNYFTTLEHFFANDVKVKASYSHTKTEGKSDLVYFFGDLDKDTGEGMDYFGSRYRNDETKQHNIDIYTSVPFELFNQNHEFIAGLSYNKIKRMADGQGSIGDISLDDYNNYKGVSEPTNWEDTGVAKIEEIERSAIYHATRLSLSEKIKLILGARLSTYKIDPINTWGTPGEYREFKNEITPYAGIVYDINHTYSVYGSYTSIFDPQNSQDKNANYLEPITGNTYEAGIKASYLDERINAFVNVYKIEQDNLAQPDGKNKVVGTIDDQAYYAAEGANSRGFEAEVSGEVIEDLNFSLGLSQFEIKDAAGKKLNSEIARKTVKLSSTYKIDKVTVGASLNWQSETSNDYTTQSSYLLTGIMARYDFTKNVSAQLNIDNLFDKKYYSGVSWYGLFYGEPRRLSAQLTYTF
jgi:outer membrane receptor for ferric coprogen and ferric-rhodotorulic acid